MAKFQRTSAGACRHTHLTVVPALYVLVSIWRVRTSCDARKCILFAGRSHDAQCFVQLEVRIWSLRISVLDPQQRSSIIG